MLIPRHGLRGLLWKYKVFALYSNVDPLMWHDLSSKFGGLHIDTGGCCCYSARLFRPARGLLSVRSLKALPSTQAVEDSAKDLRGLFTGSRLFSGAPSLLGFASALSVQLLQRFQLAPLSPQPGVTAAVCSSHGSSGTGDCPWGNGRRNVDLPLFAAYPSKVKSRPVSARSWSLSSTFLCVVCLIFCTRFYCIDERVSPV